MIELALLTPPPAIIAPEEIDRRNGTRNGSKAAIAIGTVIILDDGSECTVAGFDKNGNILCQPVSQ